MVCKVVCQCPAAGIGATRADAQKGVLEANKGDDRMRDVEAEEIVRKIHLMWVANGMGVNDDFVMLFKRQVKNVYPLLDPDEAVELAKLYEMRLRRDMGPSECTYNPPIYGWR